MSIIAEELLRRVQRLDHALRCLRREVEVALEASPKPKFIEHWTEEWVKAESELFKAWIMDQYGAAYLKVVETRLSDGGTDYLYTNPKTVTLWEGWLQRARLGRDKN